MYNDLIYMSYYEIRYITFAGGLLLNDKTSLILRDETMGLFASVRTGNSVKLIKRYVKVRIKEKRVLDDQMEKLTEQLHSKAIDEYTYERLKDVLEINYIKQRDEALEKALLNK